ncbi:MAG: HEAT repeat domain-containing protein [Actinomycetota bacterium]|nr:HEAT repeat domain-containing protein [Actinomycetota bacterium]
MTASALSALGVLTAGLVLVACSGPAEQADLASPTDEQTVAELAAVLTDPAAATDCELDPSGYVDLACGFAAAGAAEELGDRGDPAGVPALATAIDEPTTHHDAAEAAWAALERIGGPAVVDVLVEWVADDSDPLLASRAAGLLGVLGGVQHNALLVEHGGTIGCSSSGFSDALVAINRSDATPLLPYLRSFDTLWVFGPLIRLGQQGTEKALVAPFAKGWGTPDMAECYLNSGSRRLERAAEAWAAGHGYQITRLPGAGSVTWGGG